MIKLYRITVPVNGMDQATRFYRGLLCIDGERISPGWHYFDLGGMVLACHDPRAENESVIAAPHQEPIFLAVEELLAQVRLRAQNHGALMLDAEIRIRHTGEEGFLIQDPFGNSLCIVKSVSVVRGRPGGGSSTRQKSVVLLFQQEFLNAVKGGELARVKELLLLDPDLAGAADVAGVSVLLIAAYKRNAHIAEYLLSYRDHITLWEAAAVGSQQRLAALLDADGSLINHCAQDGYLPLGLACFFGHTGCVSLLIERGADVNAVSRNAMLLRPLHSAVTHDDTEKAVQIVRLLLRAGADVNAQQERGYTPLHRAADRGSLELVQLLLLAAADPLIRSDNGRTAADLAMARGYPDITAELNAARSYSRRAEAVYG